LRNISSDKKLAPELLQEELADAARKLAAKETLRKKLEVGQKKIEVLSNQVLALHEDRDECKRSYRHLCAKFAQLSASSHATEAAQGCADAREEEGGIANPRAHPHFSPQGSPRVVLWAGREKVGHIRGEGAAAERAAGVGAAAAGAGRSCSSLSDDDASSRDDSLPGSGLDMEALQGVRWLKADVARFRSPPPSPVLAFSSLPQPPPQILRCWLHRTCVRLQRWRTLQAACWHGDEACC